eukprot:140270-Alexandrium_andersonii.AAC.1
MREELRRVYAWVVDDPGAEIEATIAEAPKAQFCAIALGHAPATHSASARSMAQNAPLWSFGDQF